MTEMTTIAFALGAVLSLILQVLKRWYTFTPEAIRGAVIVLTVAYSVGMGIYAGDFNVWQFVFNLGAFIGGNQAFFGMVLNNTNTGNKIAGEPIKWDN